MKKKKSLKSILKTRNININVFVIKIISKMVSRKNIILNKLNTDILD